MSQNANTQFNAGRYALSAMIALAIASGVLWLMCAACDGMGVW